MSPYRPKYSNMMSGLLVVDKPMGWSSMDVVRKLRRVGGNAKVGHAGTLDPLATGVMVCCFGDATKLISMLMGLTKVYEAGVDLSAFTLTDDREADPEYVEVNTPPGEDELKAALANFIGVIRQQPPAFSAIQIKGERAYRRARKGDDVDLPTRPVRIDAIELLSYDWPLAQLRVTCGKGTYIRSIARDLGKALGTGGHLASLRRTAVGPYTLEGAFDEQRLSAGVTKDDLLPMPDDDAKA